MVILFLDFINIKLKVHIDWKMLTSELYVKIENRKKMVSGS